MTSSALKVILQLKQVCKISLDMFFVTPLTLDNKAQFRQCNDFGSKELSTNAAIISIGYTVLCFDVLACDEHRYLAAIDYS